MICIEDNSMHSNW